MNASCRYFKNSNLINFFIRNILYILFCLCDKSDFNFELLFFFVSFKTSFYLVFWYFSVVCTVMYNKKNYVFLHFKCYFIQGTFKCCAFMLNGIWNEGKKSEFVYKISSSKNKRKNMTVLSSWGWRLATYFVDIITTSSWRAGQELILRELGPAKTRRTSQTSECPRGGRS